MLQILILSDSDYLFSSVHFLKIIVVNKLNIYGNKLSFNF